MQGPVKCANNTLQKKVSGVCARPSNATGVDEQRQQTTNRKRRRGEDIFANGPEEKKKRSPALKGCEQAAAVATDKGSDRHFSAVRVITKRRNLFLQGDVRYFFVPRALQCAAFPFLLD